jgi:hypothetical protein
MNEYCRNFEYNSEYIFKWYKSKNSVKEESLTDWMLYYLDQNIKRFIYRENTRINESKDGADFDFWILTDNGNVAFRIQAKKLKINNHSHKLELQYPKATNKQMDNLLASSKNDGLLPLYLFYNSGETNQSTCCVDKNNSGTLIVNAEIIKSLVEGSKNIKINRERIIQVSIPLECLFCCGFFEFSKFPKNINKLLYKPLVDLLKMLKFNDEFEKLSIRKNNTIKEALKCEISDEEWSKKIIELEYNYKPKKLAILDLKKEIIK